MTGPTTVGSIDARITADTSDFERGATEVRNEARELGALSPTVDVHANVGPALAALSAVAKAERDLDVAYQRTAISQSRLDAVTKKWGEDSVQAASARLAMTRATNGERDAEERLTLARTAGIVSTDRDTSSTNANVDANNRRISGLQVLLALAPAIVAAAAPVGAAAIGLGSAFGVMATAGVFAFKGIKAEMAMGTTVGAEYSRGLDRMSDSMDALKHTTAVAMLGSFNQAVDQIQVYMPNINAMLGEFAGRLGVVGNDALKGVLSGLVQLNPLIQEGAVQIGNFVSWLVSFTADNGFSSFVQYATSNLPPVMTMIEGLVTLAGNILAAFAPLGPVVIGLITGLTTALNALPLPVLAGLVTTALLLGPALRLAFSETVVTMIGKAAVAIGLTGVAANLAVPVVGILTAAIAGLGVGVMAASLSHQQATVAVTDYTEALKEDNDALGVNVRATAAKALQDAGAFDAATKLGIAQATLTDAAMGNANAQSQVAAQVALAKDKIQQAADASSGYVSATTDTTTAQDGLVGAITTVNGAIDMNNSQIQKGVAASKNMAAALLSAGDAAGYQVSAEQALAASHGISAAAYQNATAAQASAATQLADTTAKMYLENDAAGILKAALDSLNGKSISAAQAQNQFDSSLVNMGDHVTTTGKKITFTTTSIKDMSSASVALRGQLNSQVVNLQNVIEANGGLANSTGKARAQMKTMRQQIIDNAVAHGVDRAAVTAYIDKLMAIPKSVTPTQLSVASAAAEAQLARFQAAVNALHGKEVWITSHVNSIYSETHVSNGVGGSGGQTKSDGGPIYRADGGPVYLAGGGFSRGPIGTDTVPAWLTPGEHVMKRSSAQSIGAPALKYMNDTGKIPGAGPQMVTVNMVLDGQVIDSKIVNLSTLAVQAGFQQANNDAGRRPSR